MSDTGDDGWLSIFGTTDPEISVIGNTLRKVIKDGHKDACETAYPGYNSMSYGCGPRKNTDGYAYIMPQKGYVNLGFYFGAVLPDQDELLEGTGKMLRHIKIRDTAMAESPAIARLVIAARDERLAALGYGIPSK